MDLDRLNSYFNDFVSVLSESLKPGWGMEMKVYPFTAGVVIVINMERGIAHRLIRKGESTSLGDALRKTKLFSEERITPIADKGVGDTVVGIVSTTIYVLFKGNDVSYWEGDAAKKDVDMMISKVKTVYESQR